MAADRRCSIRAKSINQNIIRDIGNGIDNGIQSVATAVILTR
jgi:hypothetical protein